jgi:hypothetical protein
MQAASFKRWIVANGTRIAVGVLLLSFIAEAANVYFTRRLLVIQLRLFETLVSVPNSFVVDGPTHTGEISLVGKFGRIIITPDFSPTLSLDCAEVSRQREF